MLDLSEHSFIWARKLACMHTMCLCIQAHISITLGLIRKIKVSMESGEHAGHVLAFSLTWGACKLACIHAICLCAQAHISARLGLIRNIKVYMESEHTRPVWAHNKTQACKLACIHTMYFLAWDHISAKLGQIREIKVSIKSGEHVWPVCPNGLTSSCNLKLTPYCY